MSYTFTFNGDDTLKIKLDGTTTDTFGRLADSNGNAKYASYGGVKSSNQNIERKLGIFNGDTDFSILLRTKPIILVRIITLFLVYCRHSSETSGGIIQATHNCITRFWYAAR